MQNGRPHVPVRSVRPLHHLAHTQGSRFARARIRSGALKTHTSGLCPGLLQANIVILPRHAAEEFEDFCRKYSRPCPLLFVSKPGQYDAPLLASQSDIRTDLPSYNVYNKGELTSVAHDITELWKDDFVTFYLGCSFSFEEVLNKHNIPVRNVDQEKNVAMYRTNQKCQHGTYQTNMVVSMRPIPASLVDLTHKVTAPLAAAHGAPVHAGDPSELGIECLGQPEFGESLEFEEGDVPVFWACGVTAIEAAISARTNICITHSPGHMYISDVFNDQLHIVDPQVQSNIRNTISKIGNILQRDPGNRGISDFTLPNQLEPAAWSLYRANHVGITTGFPCNLDFPYCETDGPPGAIALAQTLVRLGISVSFIVDKDSELVLDAARQSCPETSTIPIIRYPLDAPKEFGESLATSFDHIVAIERAGRAADGLYHTMSGRDMSSQCAPIDDLFDAASRLGIQTTAVGDGGNELGMGKVADLVRTRLPNGDLIACTTPATFTISAGTSNWGAIGLSGALDVIHASFSNGEERLLNGFSELDGRTLAAMASVGSVCGISKNPAMVDGLDDSTYNQVTIDICDLCQDFATDFKK